MARSPAEPDFQWTLAEVPDAADVSLPPVGQKPPKSGPPGRPARRLGRWVALGLLLAAGVALGTAAVLRGGWRRLEQQVAAEIAYEDAQSAAGAVDEVRAVQADGAPWWADRRAAETAWRLAAPQPGANLLPVSESAELVRLEQAASGTFTATVARRYADAAGQTFTFILAQRYQNLNPGVWARLPPDEAALTPTSVWRTGGWQTERLVVTLPTADRALLERVLPQVEAYAQAACADWGCPPELHVPLVVTGRVADLPPPGYGPRGGGALPIAFDLAEQLPPSPSDARRVIVAAPGLAGVPADAAAEAALARAWGASVLAYLAQNLASTVRHPADDYLDALIAREELRLGLSPAPDLRTAPLDYVPVEDLWTPGSGAHTAAARLARRQQALAFLNAVLHDQPATTDGRLLGLLHRRWDVETWLADSVEVVAELKAWHTREWERLNGAAPIAAAELDGVAYDCGGLVLYEGGAPQPVGLAGLAGQSWALDPASLSPDGRYVALVTVLNQFMADETQRLTVYDRATQREQPVWVSGEITLAGWAADGALLFYAQRLAPAEGLALMRYVPGAGNAERWVEPAVTVQGSLRGAAAQWSADRTGLAVTVSSDPAHPDAGQPALVDTATGRLTPVGAVGGYAPAVTPDGTAAAYVVVSETGALILLTAPEGPTTVLASAAALRAEGGVINDFSLLHWAPDGQTLGFVAVGDGGALYLLDRATRQATYVAGGGDSHVLPLGFSADGRYLAYAENTGTSDVLWLVTRALETGAETRYALVFGHLQRLLGGPGQVLAVGLAQWAPSEHLLIVSSQAGVFVYEPEVEGVRWLTLSECGRVAWFDIAP